MARRTNGIKTKNRNAKATIVSPMFAQSDITFPTSRKTLPISDDEPTRINVDFTDAAKFTVYGYRSGTADMNAVRNQPRINCGRDFGAC
jgi:hypothetical protein